jgi:hypothetical protein
MPLNGLGLYAVWKQEGATAQTDSAGKTYYLPTGFTYVTGTVSTGLVIQDSSGNQFVWVPVTSENIEYSKVESYPGTTPGSQSIDDTLPSGIASEQTQITKYGGFYVARYEAGIPTSLSTAISTATRAARNVGGVPVSKQNQVPWNFIIYSQAKANAESMYSNSYVQSGLITGTQWDVIMKWLEKKGYNVKTDSGAFGNYANTTWYTTAMSRDEGATWTTGTETSDVATLFKTGSAATISNNIYDIAGNIWEFTAEKRNGYIILRGGVYNSSSSNIMAASRSNHAPTGVGGNYGFRVVLYMK